MDTGGRGRGCYIRQGPRWGGRTCLFLRRGIANFSQRAHPPRAPPSVRPEPLIGSMEEFRLSQDRGRKALEKEREMRRTGGYPANQKLHSLGIFSQPSSCGVGTSGSPAEYDATWKTRTQGEIFCQSTSRRTGRQVLSDVESSVPGPSYSPRKFFGCARGVSRPC